MLPGFGYWFLRQRRQHSGPSVDRGTTVIGRTISIVPADVRTIREKFRIIAADGTGNRALMLAFGTTPAAIGKKCRGSTCGEPIRKQAEFL